MNNKDNSQGEGVTMTEAFESLVARGHCDNTDEAFLAVIESSKKLEKLGLIEFTENQRGEVEGRLTKWGQEVVKMRKKSK